MDFSAVSAMSARSCSSAAASGSAADSAVSSIAPARAMAVTSTGWPAVSAGASAPVSFSASHAGRHTTAAASSSAIHLFFIGFSPTQTKYGPIIRGFPPHRQDFPENFPNFCAAHRHGA